MPKDTLTPPARHHFTRFDQVDQLVGASEADAELAFMHRLMALCSLPRTEVWNSRFLNSSSGFRWECSSHPVPESPVSVLALTLIAPWALGQDPDPITEIRRQAEEGDVDAQFNIGGRYFRGVGVPEDDTEAVRWLRLAAEQGHAAGLCCNFGGRRRVT